MGRGIALGLILAAYWMALSFQTAPLLVAFGVVSVVAVTTVCVRNDVFITDWSVPRLVSVLFTYLPWLLVQVVIANLKVIRIVCSPDLPIDPQMVEIPSKLKTPTGRAVYGNSITMTPGTVTIGTGETYLIHALTSSDAEGLRNGDMHDRVLALEPGGSST